MPLTRRQFLASSAALCASALAPALGAQSAATQPATHPSDRLVRDRGLIYLPAKGTLYVASDFHTRHADFKQWLKRTQIVSRIKDNPDVYGLIVGDAADVKPNDPQAEKDGDTRIIDQIRRIQADLGRDAGRFIFIIGNHEFENARIYTALKKHFDMTQPNRMRIVRALYASDDGAYFQQFNFLERLTEEHVKFIQDLPVAVLAENGLVAVHAGPSRKAVTPGDIAGRLGPVLDELLWSRPEQIQLNGYTAEHLDQFLHMMHDSSLLLAGHTPLGLLPPEWVQKGIGVFADKQIILGTSYGSEPGEKSYLVFDLSRCYAHVKDLNVDAEIQRLYDNRRASSGRAPQHLARRARAELALA